MNPTHQALCGMPISNSSQTVKKTKHIRTPMPKMCVNGNGTYNYSHTDKVKNLNKSKGREENAKEISSICSKMGNILTLVRLADDRFSRY